LGNRTNFSERRGAEVIWEDLLKPTRYKKKRFAPEGFSPQKPFSLRKRRQSKRPTPTSGKGILVLLVLGGVATEIRRKKFRSEGFLAVGTEGFTMRRASENRWKKSSNRGMAIWRKKNWERSSGERFWAGSEPLEGTSWGRGETQDTLNGQPEGNLA